jgi:hypothetical protein
MLYKLSSADARVAKGIEHEAVCASYRERDVGYRVKYKGFFGAGEIRYQRQAI